MTDLQSKIYDIIISSGKDNVDVRAAARELYKIKELSGRNYEDVFKPVLEENWKVKEFMDGFKKLCELVIDGPEPSEYWRNYEEKKQ